VRGNQREGDAVTAPGEALTWEWTVEAGERAVLHVPVLDDAGQPVSVTGWVVDAAVKTEPGGTVLYAFDSDGAAVPDGTRVTLTIPEDVTAAFVFRRAWYRVKVVDPVNGPVRLVQGPFVVSPD
jgi:hypothetical protein